MASTYSNLKIQLMATGENSGTWGNVTNVNLGTALEEAIVGSADVTFASANVTLTLTDTNASQTARNLRLNLTGTTGGARDLIVPAIEKVYIVNNGCADTVTVKVTGQTGVAVPAGRSYLLYNNGTDVLNAIEGMSVVSGGTGLETLTAESVVIGNGTNAVKFVAPGTSSNVLTSNGTAWVSQAAATTTNANAITTGILSVGVGGTGASTLTAENVIIGNTTGAVKFVAPGTSGNVLTSNGSVWASTAPAAPSAPAALSTASGSAPSYSARAWVNFNGIGTVAINAQGNVSSITDNGTGDYTINFNTAMPDGNYSACGFGVGTDVTNVAIGAALAFYPTGTGTFIPATKTASASRIIIGQSNAGILYDVGNISFNVFR